jgi:hypothetical protein
MEDIEILLALADAPDSLSIDEVRTRLRLPAGGLSRSGFDHLIGAQLVVAEPGDGPPRFRFAPGSPELRRAVELLRVAYNERPVTLVRLVYQRPTTAQAFADAFRIRREDDE